MTDPVTRCPHCGRLAPVLAGRVVAHFGRDLAADCPGSSVTPSGEVAEYEDATKRPLPAAPLAAPLAAARPAAGGPARTLLDPEG